METQKQRRNRLARERYTQNESTRERYQLKARAAISDRNEKRKVVLREKAKEDGYIFCGSRKYNINALILESYEQERRAIIRLNSDAMFWKTDEGREYAAESLRSKACLRLRTIYHNMNPEEKTQYGAKRKEWLTIEKKREYSQRYHEKLKNNNPEKLKEMQRKYRITSRSKPLNRAKSNMRNRFRDALKHYRQTQRDTMSSMIGCTWAFFDKWISSQFKRGMKWENYGSIWHIDHIEPLAHFDVTDQNDMKRAWHYSNLRPLKAAENLKKGAKIVTCQPELSITII
jgi:hypothetical protein